jgi:hypothetical protein
VPVVIPVTPLFGEVGDVNTPAPDTNDQLPVPVTGVLALSVMVDVQMLDVLPADEIVGGTSLFITTVEVDGGHVPLEIVHWKELTPNPKPVIPEVGEVGVVIVPLPDIKVHSPVPTIGAFPAKVAVDVQTVWVDPALETVGKGSRTTVTLTVDDGHTPLVILHWYISVPTEIPVTMVVFVKNELGEPVPETTDQLPVPIAGIFPVIVAVPAHSV